MQPHCLLFFTGNSPMGVILRSDSRDFVFRCFIKDCMQFEQDEEVWKKRFIEKGETGEYMWATKEEIIERVGEQEDGEVREVLERIL